MNNPTNTKADEVTAGVITPNNGARNNAKKNITAVDTAVNPVLLPSATPDALSTNVLTVLVPKQAPKVVPTASANKVFLILGTFPFSSNIFAFVATSTNVPIVSNISINRIVNNTIAMSIKKILFHWNFRALEPIDGGMLIIPFGRASCRERV